MANEAALINRKKDPNFNFVKVILLNFFHLRFFIRMCLKIKNCYYFVMINFANLVINLFLTLQKDLVIHFLLFNYQNFNLRLLGVAILIDLFIQLYKVPFFFYKRNKYIYIYIYYIKIKWNIIKVLIRNRGIA